VNVSGTDFISVFERGERATAVVLVVCFKCGDLGRKNTGHIFFSIKGIY
jgi:hypothetical protein